MDNMGFGIKYAKRLGWGSDFRVAEMRSEVALALFKAAKTFDPKKGKFTTIAAYWIRKQFRTTINRRNYYVYNRSEWVQHAKVCSMEAAALREREEDTQVPWESYAGLQQRDDPYCPSCERLYPDTRRRSGLCDACNLRKRRNGICNHCCKPRFSRKGQPYCPNECENENV